MPAPIAVTIKEGTRLTGMSRTRIYELIGQYRLEAVKTGRRTLLRVASLENYMAWRHCLGRKSARKASKL
jgi:excisionase family DNA binding protein